MSSKIAWCDETLNPVKGCTGVSLACDHCYAERMAGRLAAMGQTDYQNVVYGRGPNARWNGKIVFSSGELEKIKHWRAPRTCFMVSMGDLFHNSVPLVTQCHVFQAMAEAPQHKFFVLSKRDMREKMDAINSFLKNNGFKVPLANVGGGATIENQQCADLRVRWLLNTAFAMRFVSIEPMLGPICLDNMKTQFGGFLDALNGFAGGDHSLVDLHDKQIHWVICGGESGPKARPMHPDWVRSLRDQCSNSIRPFFFKQWGEFLPEGQEDSAQGRGSLNISDWNDAYLAGPEFSGDGQRYFHLGSKRAGRLFDGVKYSAFPKGWEARPKRDKS